MKTKPMGSHVDVEIVENKIREDSPGGLLAEVLAVGPEAKGVKRGDAVLVSEWCLPEEERAKAEMSFQPYRTFVDKWSVMAIVTDA